MMINVCCTVNPKVTVYQIRFDRVEVTETVEIDASKDTSLHPLNSMVTMLVQVGVLWSVECALFFGLNTGIPITP
jgi:hypothetical protein